MADHLDDDLSFWNDGSRRRPDSTGATSRSGFERTREHKIVTRGTPPPVEAVAVEHNEATPVTDDELWARYGAGDTAESGVDAWVEPERERPRAASGLGVDPRLLRLGALVAATVVLVPVALAVASGGSSDDVKSSETTVGTIAPAPAQAPPATGVTVTAAATLDPSVEAAEDADDDPAAVAAGEKGDPGADEPECAGTYTVVAGDYWLRFVDSSGATLDEWLVANDAQPDTQMYEGDELCIPAGAQAPEPIAATTVAPETTAAPETTPAPTAAPTTAAPAPAPDPAPAPAAAPTPAAPAPQRATAPASNGAPAGVAGPAEVEALIREIWPDDIEDRAIRIADNEANLRPDLNNWCCYGVFALYFDYVPSDLKAQYGVDEPNDLYDPRTNISIAYQVYLRGGWEPWSQTDPGA